MKTHSLCAAVELFESLSTQIGELMLESGGQDALDPIPNEALYQKISELLMTASRSVDGLSDRAKCARLSLIWKDFVKKETEERGKFV